MLRSESMRTIDGELAAANAKPSRIDSGAATAAGDLVDAGV